MAKKKRRNQSRANKSVNRRPVQQYKQNLQGVSHSQTQSTAKKRTAASQKKKLKKQLAGFAVKKSFSAGKSAVKGTITGANTAVKKIQTAAEASLAGTGKDHISDVNPGKDTLQSVSGSVTNRIQSIPGGIASVPGKVQTVKDVQAFLQKGKGKKGQKPGNQPDQKVVRNIASQKTAVQNLQKAATPSVQTKAAQNTDATATAVKVENKGVEQLLTGKSDALSRLQIVQDSGHTSTKRYSGSGAIEKKTARLKRKCKGKNGQSSSTTPYGVGLNPAFLEDQKGKKDTKSIARNAVGRKLVAKKKSTLPTSTVVSASETAAQTGSALSSLQTVSVGSAKTAGRAGSALGKLQTTRRTVVAVKTSAKVARTATTAAGATATAVSTTTAVAATAASGGTATVVTVPVAITRRIARRLTQQAMESRKNNPLMKIFRIGQIGQTQPDMTENQTFSLLKFIFSLLSPLTILSAVLFSGFMIIVMVVVMITTVLSNPLKALFGRTYDLSDMEDLMTDEAFMSELEEWRTSEDFLTSGITEKNAELQALYDAHMKTINTTATAMKSAGLQVIYDDYEGQYTPSNYRAVYAVLMGICSGESNSISGAADEEDEMATTSIMDVVFLTDAAKDLFADLLDQMCTIKTEKVDMQKREGHIHLMGIEEYISTNKCSDGVAQAIRAVYNEISLPSNQNQSGTGENGTMPVQEVPEDIAAYCAGLTHLPGVQGTVIQSALAKQGIPYSQDYRDSGQYYDCSSFVFYSYKSAGINMVYGGATTAAAEAQYCEAHGQLLSVDDIRPGDLLFYSYRVNGRYKNISHVEMYLGDGLVIDCTEAPGVSIRAFTTDRLVLCGRPY